MSFTYGQRMSVAEEHEQAVDTELERRGWKQMEFGAATLPYQPYAHLKVLPVALRWRPDRIAWKPDAQMTAAFVDGKARMPSNRDSANYTIECASLESLVGHAEANGMPCYIVFDDFQIVSAEDLTALADEGKLGHGDFGRGSGTPYWLIPRKFAHDDMDSIFGWPE